MTESGEHFIGDEEDIVFGAKAADALEEFARMDNHAAGALQ